MANDSVEKRARRVEVLLDFRSRALAAGHAVPSAEDMVRIAETQEIWPSGIDVALARPWKRTIEELFKQIHFGMTDPIDTLSSELRRPSGEIVGRTRGTDRPTVPAGPSASASPEDDPVLAALRRWQAANKGRSALQALKDHHLNNIARTGSRKPDEIARRLPREVAGLAAEIAAVVEAALAAEPAAPAAGPGEAATVYLKAERPGRTPAAPARRIEEEEVPAEPPPPTGSGPDPSAGPSPTPSRGSPRSADPDEQERLKALVLADGEHWAGDRPPFELRKRKLPTGGVALSWPAVAGAAVTLYRVVSIDDFYPPRRPQDATPITVSTGLSYVDDRPFGCAVRHVQVWCHQGATEEDAAAAAPVLHAGVLVVAPPRDAVVNEDSGHVTGWWAVFDGVERVDVKRYRQGDWQRLRLNAEFDPVECDDNLGGFVDDSVAPGRRYVYTVAAEVVVDGTHYFADAVEFDVAVPGVLAQVHDLGVLERGDRVDLSWTPPPAGEVRLYRTPNGPAAGAMARALPLDELAERTGLSPEARLAVPDRRDDRGRGVMRGVGFLRGHTRMYVTPVTVLDGQAWVGRSVSTVRLPQVAHAVVVERTHRQVLTFAWPSGADLVLAWVGMPDQPLDAAMTTRPEEISRDQYERQGGMYFRYPLWWRGAAVHVAAVAYTGGRRLLGRPITVPYPGLMRLRYTLRATWDQQGRRMHLAMQILAEYDNRSAPAFVLVHHPERLPLHLDDGSGIAMRATGDPAAVEGIQFRPSELVTNPGPAAWTYEGPALSGYVRLFACLEDDQQLRVAVLDPPASALRLGAPHRQAP